MTVKSGSRILAIEDSPFRRWDKDALAIGVIGRQDIIEGVLSFRVDVDGTNSAKNIISSVSKSRFASQVRLIALNGNTIAGSNIVDTREINRSLKVPVISITRTRPHPQRLKVAIKKSAPPRTYAAKAALIDHLSSSGMVSKVSGFYVQHAGMGIAPSDIKRLVAPSVALLRLAHIIASGVVNGESKGRL